MSKDRKKQENKLKELGYIGSLPEIFEAYVSFEERELPFYEWLVEKYGEPILELGCSTAYLLIPLARKGIEVAGIDMNKNFLDYANKKLAKESQKTRNKIALIHGNILDLKLTKKFKVIYITCGAFGELLTQEEQIKMLQQARNWLHSEGVFVLETEIPHYKLQGWGGYKGTWGLTWNEYIPRIGKTVYSWGARVWNHFTQTAKWEEIEDLADKEGNIKRKKTEGKVRYTYPSEVELLFKLTGFKVIERFGGDDRRPFDYKSQWVLYLARKTK
ncbi:MAG: class I SAM-dependent methyltransferase [bacterium]|nr:class I SAM-dependent methyltransferase [bacterium]